MKNNNTDFSARTKISRILFLFSFCFLFLQSYSANIETYNQEKTFTFEMWNKPVKEVLNYIEKNSQFIFFYYNNTIDIKRNVSLSVKDKPITFVLDQLFKGMDVRYEIKDRQISLKKNEGQQYPQSKKQQKRKLIGTVMDASTDDLLVGVSISVKGTPGVGTITDLEGKFSIEVSNNTELEFSYIGYKKRSLMVGDLGVLNVKMASDNEMLSEVVVVGAGTQKKISVTGSITSVKGEGLRSPSSTLTNNFAGKLAGVVAVTKTGEPGAASEFYIRGVSTFGGRATPLILMDGVEISSGDLNRIPSESIESFSILKDASATAIYGARGANGVMLVTTKNGAENSKATINVSFENSFMQPTKMVDYVDGATWMEIYNEALLTRTPGASPKYSKDVIDLTRSHTSPYLAPDVNWRDVMFKDMTMNQRANVNVSGGGSRVTYYLSLQANHDTGMLDIPKTYSFDNNINRWDYIFQNNIAYKLTSTTKVGLRMNAQIGQHKGPGYSVSDLFKYAYYANPITFPATYPSQEGDTHIRFGNAWLTQGERTYLNPYAKMMESFKEENYSTLNTTLNIEQDLGFVTEGLSVKALINFKSYAASDYTRTMEPFYYLAKMSSTEDNLQLERIGNSGQEYIQEGEIQKANDNTFYLDARIDYSRTFGQKHSVSGMLMYMQREYRNGTIPNRNQGFSGRFTYDYKHKYLVEVNFGYNGTERLGKNDRFEFFPAMSLGWVASGEDFWKPIEKYVNYFKIRGSYGLVGSDETGLQANPAAAHFLYLDEVNLTGSGGYHTGYLGNIGGDYKGPVINSYAVTNAGWERVKKLDIGVDLELFNQVNLTFDYFYDKRYNILMRRASWPVIMGYQNAVPWSNIGAVDNMGCEFSINWRKELFKEFIIDMRGNLTYNKNKYIYKDEPNYPYVWKSDTGRPLSTTKGYIAEGLFASQEEINVSPTQSLGSTVMPGDIKYRDVNGDGLITEDDMVVLSDYGNIPRIQYGLGVNITYKKFDFGVFFNGSAQRTIMVNGISPFFSDMSYGERNLMSFIAKDYWSERNPNPNAAYPRLGIQNSQIENNMKASSYWMRNGNFIRFKTLELGYTFPHCRIYLSGDNLAVWSPFKLWDPELGYDSYPLSRTFNVGVQLKF